jgi:hypothetical protein
LAELPSSRHDLALAMAAVAPSSRDAKSVERQVLTATG